MEKVELQVQPRNESGKGSARKLRAEERMPVVFYGPHMKNPVSLTVETRAFSKMRKHGTNVLLTLKAADLKDIDGKVAVVKDQQIHPVNGHYMHADLLEVRMDEAIQVSVPIILVGKSKGVAEGGIMEQSRRELDVECLPDRIPDKLEVDVTEMEMNDSLHVDDIPLPEGVKYAGTANFTIAAVVAPQAEEEKPAVEEGELAEGEVAADGEAPAEGAAPADGAAPAEGGEKKDAAPAEEKK